MPNITTSKGVVDVDTWRRNPGRLLFTHDLANAGVFRSYDALRRAIRSGAFPRPYKLPGGKMAWEARAVLRAIGAPLACLILSLLFASAPAWAAYIPSQLTVVSGARSLAATDSGKTFSLQGARYTVTIGAPGSYPSLRGGETCRIQLINESQRGKNLSVSGAPSNCTIIYPGQVYTFTNDGSGSWATNCPERWFYKGLAVKFYVATTGNDTSDCMDVADPCLTILHAWNQLRDYTDGPTPIIQVLAGTYTGVGELDGDDSSSFGRLIGIQGDPTLTNPPFLQSPNNGTAISFRDGAWASLNGFLFGASSGSGVGIAVQQGALCDVQNLQWGAGNSVGISVSDHGHMNVIGNQTFTGANGVAWATVTFGAKMIFGSGLTFSGASSNYSVGFIQIDGGAKAQLQGPVTSTIVSAIGPRHAVSRMSLYNNNTNLLPGNSACTVDQTSMAY